MHVMSVDSLTLILVIKQVKTTGRCSVYYRTFLQYLQSPEIFFPVVVIFQAACSFKPYKKPEIAIQSGQISTTRR